MAQREKPEAGEKTLIKTTGFCSFGDKLRKQYPEAFNRPYDRASGLSMERVLQ
jgi:hypothetical protein